MRVKRILGQLQVKPENVYNDGGELAMARLSSSSSSSFSSSAAATLAATAASSFILTLCILCIPIGSHGKYCRRRMEEGVPSMYIFGDSYLDSGNNNYINTTTLDQANFWPYGQTFFHFPTGRFSDGRLVSDFIAEYAKVALIRAFLQPGIEQYYRNGVNFASAGAGALLQTFQGAVINLSTQLRNYEKVVGWLRRDVGDAAAETTLSKAVYLFSIGSNDYMSPFLTNSTILQSYSHSKYVGMVLGNLTMAFKEVYKSGGRKFMFLNLGPLGCLPGLRIIEQESNGGCLEEASTLAELHNKALSEMLSEAENQLKDFKYVLYDFNSSLSHRMNHPSKYGLKEGKIACCGIGRFRGEFSCGGRRPVKEFELCGNPNDYVFWDSFHLTEKVYKQMADEMWGGSPYKLNNLFQCLY